MWSPTLKTIRFKVSDKVALRKYLDLRVKKQKKGREIYIMMAFFMPAPRLILLG
jgi:hypothetical protein